MNFEAGTLTVRQSLQRTGGKSQLCETKTDRSRRTIALPPSLVSALRAHRTRQIEERLLGGSRWQDSGLIFVTTIGTPLEPRNINRQFAGLLKRVELPAVRFHDLRHSCATMLLVQGVSARVVADILGHSRPSTTTDIYQHVIPQLQREAAERMEALFTGAG